MAENDEGLDDGNYIDVKIELTIEHESEIQLNPEIPKEKRKRKSMKGVVGNLCCDHCDYRTPYKKCLYYHLMDHEASPPFACDICPYRTKYPQTLRRHIFSKHQRSEENTPTYKCTECSYVSILKTDLTAHQKKHSADKKFKCSMCDYATVYRNLLKKHFGAHHVEKKVFQCDKCDFVGKAEGYLLRHLSTVHKETIQNVLKCDNCNFITKVRWRLNVHRRKSYQDNTVNCKNCSFCTRYMCELRMHKQIHMSNLSNHAKLYNNTNEDLDMEGHSYDGSEIQQNSFIQIDDETLEEIDWSNIPVNETNSDKPYQCTLCEYCSKYKASVQRHFQRRHMVKKNPHKCMYCYFSTKTREQLMLHSKRSKCEALQMCNLCDFSTYFKCQLSFHQKSHQFRCDICDYTSKNLANVQQHLAKAHSNNMNKC